MSKEHPTELDQEDSYDAQLRPVPKSAKRKPPARSDRIKGSSEETIGVLNMKGVWEARRVCDMSDSELHNRLRKNGKSRTKWAHMLVATSQLLDSGEVEEGREEAETAIKKALSTMTAMQTNREKLLAEQTKRREARATVTRAIAGSPKSQSPFADSDDDDEED